MKNAIHGAAVKPLSKEALLKEKKKSMQIAKIEKVLRKELKGTPNLDSLITRTYNYLEDCDVGYESEKVSHMIVFVAEKLIAECDLENPLPLNPVYMPRKRTKLQKPFPADRADALLKALRSIIPLPSPHAKGRLEDNEKKIYDFIHEQVRGRAYMKLRTLLYEGYIENFYVGDEEAPYYQRCKETTNRLRPLFVSYKENQSRLSLIDDCEVPIEASALIRHLITLTETKDSVLNFLLKPKAGDRKLDKSKPDLLDAIHFLSHTKHFINQTMPDSPINGRAMYQSIELGILNIFRTQLSNLILKDREPPQAPTAHESEKMQKLDEARGLVTDPIENFLTYAFEALSSIDWADAPHTAPIYDESYDEWKNEVETLDEMEEVGVTLTTDNLNHFNRVWNNDTAIWENAVKILQNKDDASPEDWERAVKLWEEDKDAWAAARLEYKNGK